MPVLFSFRLKFPYLLCLRNPSGTVAATHPLATAMNPLLSLGPLCRIDLRGLDRASGTPQSNGQRSAGYVAHAENGPGGRLGPRVAIPVAISPSLQHRFRELEGLVSTGIRKSARWTPSNAHFPVRSPARKASLGESTDGIASLVGRRKQRPGYGRISLQFWALMNCERCLALVVATTTSDGAGPKESAWAARITSMSRSLASAVGRPRCRAFAQSSAANRSASSESGR